MSLCRYLIHCNLLRLVDFWIERRLLVFAAQSPAPDARDWVQDRAADGEAHSHHVERVVVAVGDVIITFMFGL